MRRVFPKLAFMDAKDELLFPIFVLIVEGFKFDCEKDDSATSFSLIP